MGRRRWKAADESRNTCMSPSLRSGAGGVCDGRTKEGGFSRIGIGHKPCGRRHPDESASREHASVYGTVAWGAIVSALSFKSRVDCTKQANKPYKRCSPRYAGEGSTAYVSLQLTEESKHVQLGDAVHRLVARTRVVPGDTKPHM